MALNDPQYKNLTFLEFEELPYSQPGALMDNADDDIFCEEWCDDPADPLDPPTPVRPS